MNVLGLDLSLTSTGLAYVEGGTLIEVANIKSKGNRDATKSDVASRLRGIAADVLDYSFSADLVVIEAPSFNSKFGLQHERAGLWWMVVEGLDSKGYPMVFVAPKQRAKYATGNGNAGKQEVFAAAVNRYGASVTNDDIADAVILAAMGARLVGEPMPCEMDLTTKHLATVLQLDIPFGIPA